MVGATAKQKLLQLQLDFKCCKQRFCKIEAHDLHKSLTCNLNNLNLNGSLVSKRTYSAGDVRYKKKVVCHRNTVRKLGVFKKKPLPKKTLKIAEHNSTRTFNKAESDLFYENIKFALTSDNNALEDNYTRRRLHLNT